MATLRIHDLPESIHLRLAERARREHRTISQEATVLLARALDLSRGNVERRRSVLKGLRAQPLLAAPAHLRPPEELVREDREQ